MILEHDWAAEGGHVGVEARLEAWPRELQDGPQQDETDGHAQLWDSPCLENSVDCGVGT